TDYLERAGLRAIELNAFATARSHLQAAFETASAVGVGDVRRYQLLGHLDDVLGVLGRRDEQRQVIDEMALIAEALPVLHGDLERRRAWLLAQTGELQQAETSARRSVAVERSDGDEEGVASSLVALGTIQRWSGRPLEAIPALTEAVELANDPSDRADALTELASTLVEVQQVDQALEHLAEAGEIYRSLDDLRGQAEVAGIEARLLHRHGDKEEAVGRYEEAIELCHRIGYRHGEGVNLTNLANLQQLTGAVADALAGYDRAARIFAEMSNKRGVAVVLANSASARHTLLGEDGRARTDALTAMRHFHEIGDRPAQAQCEEIIAGIEARAGNQVEARRLLQISISELQGTGNAILEGQHLRSLAQLEIADGNIPEALSALDQAQTICRDAALDDLAIDLSSIRGLAYLVQGDHQSAFRVTYKAVKSLSASVERPYLIYYRHALASEAIGKLDQARTATLRADQLLREALAGLDHQDLQRALKQVPEHDEIVAKAKEFGPRVIDVMLPMSDVPTGRPLGDDDLRLVRWTIEHPDDQSKSDALDRRRGQLLRLIREAEASGAIPTTDHLAEALSVSASTVRRDLHVLRANGHSLRTRGQRETG
ncbi:MAG TPA: tetratricopeptide repeat protein, partial [Acidimicrobiia bacterium]|nr:tetratricopeptide repeat protein [Acidimicrobiia bacterium]